MPKTNIKVKMIGEDGNAFAIMGRVIKALKEGGRADLVEEYKKEAMSSDYANLLRVTDEYIVIE